MSASVEHVVAAPIVDQAYFDPFLIGDEAIQWLRGVEIEVRALGLQLADTTLAAGPPLWLLGEAQAMVERFLRADGEIERALHRPVSHLRPGMPARSRIERAVTQLRERTNTALVLASRVAQLVEEVGAARGEYEQDLPTFLSEYLAAAGLTQDRFYKIRSVRDVARYEARLAMIVSALSELRLAASESGADTEVSTPSDALTITELRALRTRAIRARTSLTGLPGAGTLARETAVGLLRIADVARRERPAAGDVASSDATSGITASLVEDAAVQALERANRQSTASFWVGAVAASARALRPIGGRYSWLPPLGRLATAVAEAPPTASLGGDESGATMYCVPIGRSHVLLSPRIRSGIRVYSDSIGADKVIECTVTPASDPPGGSALMDENITPLFDGLDVRYSRWYRTKRRLRVSVIANDGEEWYARVDRLGQVETLSDHPVSASVGLRVPSAFRIRRDCSEEAAKALGANDTALTVRREGALDKTLGLQTFRVATPFEAHPVALLRRPVRASRRTVDATFRERDLFQALSGTETVGQTPCLTPVGLGRVDDTSQLWPCYALPPVTWPRADELEREWIKGDSRRLLQYLKGVARILLGAHDRGFSIGVVTMRQFALVVDWEAGSGEPVPRPMLMTAPTAAALGSTYLAPPGQVSSPDDVDTYSWLGASVVPPDVAGQLQASMATDAFGFGMFTLDLLVRSPTSGPIETLPQRLASDWRLTSGMLTTDVEIMRGVANALADLDLDLLGRFLKAVGDRTASWSTVREAVS